MTHFQKKNKRLSHTLELPLVVVFTCLEQLSVNCYFSQSHPAI